MKVHPLLLLMVLCALGRFTQTAPPATAPAVNHPPEPVQLVPTGNQRAEIETPQGKFTVEAGVSIKE